jgi:hypothetical protein
VIALQTDVKWLLQRHHNNVLQVIAFQKSFYEQVP